MFYKIRKTNNFYKYRKDEVMAEKNSTKVIVTIIIKKAKQIVAE